jgi:hypothetical protein
MQRQNLYTEPLLPDDCPEVVRFEKMLHITEYVRTCLDLSKDPKKLSVSN